MLQNNNRVIIPNSRLHQPLGILRVVRRNDLQPRYTGVPRREALGMLRRRPRRIAVRPTEHDGTGNVPRTHVILLGGGVDNLIDRLHGKVPRHEFDNGSQVFVRRADGHAGESHLGDGRVDDAFGAVLLEEALGHLVGSLVLRHLLSEDEDFFVAFHFLVDGGVDGVANGHIHGGHGAFGLALEEARGRMALPRYRSKACTEHYLLFLSAVP
mmetsp:Transcript_42257/g.72162  ORF Transcript_42257/g.72162 Transcript_42257/m.72162 type:complete len:212 (-) Transcript_42257:78-713(-)